MATIYRVQYSEDVGFFVRVMDNVTKIRSNGSDIEWSESGDELGTYTPREPGEELILHSEGWRESEQEAVDIWRTYVDKLADSYRVLAYELDNLASGPSPVIPAVRIMMPELK